MFFLWFLKVLPFCFFAAVVNFFYAGFGCVMKIRWEIYGMSIHMTYPSNTIEVSEIERNKKKRRGEKNYTKPTNTHAHDYYGRGQSKFEMRTQKMHWEQERMSHTNAINNLQLATATWFHDMASTLCTCWTHYFIHCIVCAVQLLLVFF